MEVQDGVDRYCPVSHLNWVYLNISVSGISSILTHFCEGGTKSSEPILPIFELDRKLLKIYRCTKFGLNRLLPSRATCQIILQRNSSLT